MTLEEILPHLKSGKKCRRKKRMSDSIYIENDYFVFPECTSTYIVLSTSAILANDWEIVE